MIHYALRCAEGHEFDGWFRSSAAFDSQAQAGLLACPACNSTRVSRAMMAPRLSSGVPAPMAAPAEPPRTATDAAGAQAVITNLPALPDHLRAALQKLRADVERNCDYVGPRFADLARAMHDGRSAPRAIYGETTPGEATALAEDGIEVSAIPWVPRADA